MFTLNLSLEHIKYEYVLIIPHIINIFIIKFGSGGWQNDSRAYTNMHVYLAMSDIIPMDLQLVREFSCRDECYVTIDVSLKH